MKIQSFVVSPVQSNCYVVSESDESGSKAVIIDPGDLNLQQVFDYIDSKGFQVIANWNTHAHFDHVMGVDIVRNRYHIASYVHEADLPIWNQLTQSVQAWMGKVVEPLNPPDGFFEDGDTISLGNEKFTVFHTPGHSPGCVCFVGTDVVFTGDTLFAGSIGRTDLPLSNGKAMLDSLKRLLDWPDHLVLYPGHMQSTTMERERRMNPFLQDID